MTLLGTGTPRLDINRRRHGYSQFAIPGAYPSLRGAEEMSLRSAEEEYTCRPAGCSRCLWGS